MWAITGGKIIRGRQEVHGQALIFAEKVIGMVPAAELDRFEIEKVIDARGAFVAPGFIDMHLHGLVGEDASDGELHGLHNICRALPGTGVTSFLPTIMTLDEDAMRRGVRVVAQAMQTALPDGAQILGCHLEGPFLNPEHAGAQQVDYFRAPDHTLLAGFQGVVRRVTLAPELPGSESFMVWCREAGILLSFGHSRATYEMVQQAVGWGGRLVTHTFNGMAPFHHRQPGLLGAALEDERLTCELIADNQHVHPAAQRLLLRAKGVDKVVLVTDAMRACLLGRGRYTLGGQQVTVKDGCARLADGTLAGSILPLNRALNNLRRNSGLSHAEILLTVTANPARLLGLQGQKGCLEPGHDADIVIFDEDFKIHSTYVKGQLV